MRLLRWQDGSETDRRHIRDMYEAARSRAVVGSWWLLRTLHGKVRGGESLSTKL